MALEDNNLELIQFALESLVCSRQAMNNAELTYQVDKALEQVSLGAPFSRCQYYYCKSTYEPECCFNYRN